MSGHDEEARIRGAPGANGSPGCPPRPQTRRIYLGRHPLPPEPPCCLWKTFEKRVTTGASTASCRYSESRGKAELSGQREPEPRVQACDDGRVLGTEGDPAFSINIITGNYRATCITEVKLDLVVSVTQILPPVR